MLFNLFTPSYPVVDVNIPEGWWKSDSQLDIDFANGRSFNRKTVYKGRPDDLLTYTSPSPKMVYSKSGILEYARHNLLTYSEQFDNAAWTKSASSISSNAAIATNGAMAADKLIENSASTLHYAYSTTLAANNQTLSVYIKAGERTWAWLYIASIGEAVAYFDLANGVLGTVTGTISPTATITDAGNGWYRCSISARSVSTSACGVGITTGNGVTSYTGDGTSGIYVWGAQRNLGSVMLDYLSTVSAAKYDLPIDHDPLTHAPLGVLIEEQRTNLLTYSQEFDNASWSKSSATIAANDAVAPDGTTTADKLKPDAAATNGRVIQTFTGAIGTTYTLSIYAAADEFSNLRLYFDDGATNTASVSYNLTTGAITTALAITGGNWTSAATTYTDVGDGWRRVTLTFTATAVAPTRMAYWCRDTGDGTSGIHVWGAQLEAGAFATSYIPTVASQVTRAADQVSVLTSAFGYSAAAGTVLAEGSIDGNGTGSTGWWALDAGATQNGHALRVAVGSNILAISRGTTGNQTVIGLVGPVAGTFYETAVAYSSNNDRAISTDGGAVVSGTTDVGTINSATTLRFGFQQVTTTGGYLNGHISRLTYWNTRKTDAELQGLTV